MLTSISLITNPHVQGWTLWVCHKSVVGRMGIFCSSYHVFHNEELLQIHRVLPNRSAQKTTYSLCPYDQSFPAQLLCLPALTRFLLPSMLCDVTQNIAEYAVSCESSAGCYQVQFLCACKLHVNTSFQWFASVFRFDHNVVQSQLQYTLSTALICVLFVRCQLQ